jgi:hypothetical protein
LPPGAAIEHVVDQSAGSDAGLSRH